MSNDDQSARCALDTILIRANATLAPLLHPRNLKFGRVTRRIWASGTPAKATSLEVIAPDRWQAVTAHSGTTLVQKTAAEIERAAAEAMEFLAPQRPRVCEPRQPSKPVSSILAGPADQSPINERRQDNLLCPVKPSFPKMRSRTNEHLSRQYFQRPSPAAAIVWLE